MLPLLGSDNVRKYLSRKALSVVFNILTEYRGLILFSVIKVSLGSTNIYQLFEDIKEVMTKFTILKSQRPG